MPYVVIDNSKAILKCNEGGKKNYIIFGRSWAGLSYFRSYVKVNAFDQNKLTKMSLSSIQILFNGLEKKRNERLAQ